MKRFRINQQELPPSFHVQQATSEDTQDILNLLLETAKWLQAQGSSQWSALLEGHDVHGTGDAIARGDVFLFKDGDKIAGMVILLTEPSAWDMNLWGETGHEESIYVHRLAINREYAGQGLGANILAWVHQGIEIEGKSNVRLDCIESNDALYRFYNSFGMIYRGSVKGFHLFEQPQTHQR
ncbi:GNAT family N-acetyltransferase [Paenibacillus sp. 1001270B_150601_E10]|uniref:GNAT family N-acetyltransferase n=1 Tax=Paenibacillus sp. 1001270B_150601_E10 TaxID=2787079 RepID=UPI00189D5322|nr:GNAT family N-acetyltransferase [Paenibacillus sp. 1001270B_150601_E10]